MEDGLWVGMAACPAPDCPFAIRVESDTEADLDLVAVAAFEAHAANRHPGVPLADIRSYHQDVSNTDRRLIN